MNTNNYHPMVLPVGAPRKVIVANGVVCRFGFKDRIPLFLFRAPSWPLSFICFILI